MRLISCAFVVAMVALFGGCQGVERGAPVALALETGTGSPAVSGDVVGLSYETSLLLPDAHGTHYFRGDNLPLITLFKTLGVRSLRVGGNSVDAGGIAVPNEEDIRDLLDFAKATGVKLIYSVRLQGAAEAAGIEGATKGTGDTASNANSAARIAKFIRGYAPEVMDCFAIGNEPSYLKDYGAYRAHWTAVRDAILAVYPEATFCGPDQNPAPELDKKMVLDFGNASGRLVKITQHSYPFGCSFKNPKMKSDVSKLIPVDAAAGREKMLAPTAYTIYGKIYDGIAAAISGTQVTFALSETNSFWFSGLKGASDSYASALWAVDYLHWWAARGASSVNFHTGDRTGGEVTLPCHYAAFVTSGKGYEVRPLSYGMKLFDLGGYGRVVPINVVSGGEHALCEYATISDDKVVSITLINKSHGKTAETLRVHIALDAALKDSRAQVIFLREKNNDISDGAGTVTLGGAEIKEDGTWNGHWSPLPVRDGMGKSITVKLPPASAAVVRAAIR